ncbi:glutathione S-transferase [Dichotomocladium elegans]|nr:glutathione S-transferase [Dichotomocladium elegans]
MTDQEKKLTLYHYFRSSASWRVRLVFEWKGVSYDKIAINLLKKENLTNPEFAKVNPSRRVPALVLPDGKVLTQSLAIMEYLNEVYPDRPLYPSDPFLRAQVREMCLEIACDIHPLQNTTVLADTCGDDAAKRDAWASKYTARGFEGVEKRLMQTSGKYCFGDEITMADFMLVPQYYNALRYNLDMTPFPHIARIAETLLALPEFVAASPAYQEDAPPEMRAK